MSARQASQSAGCADIPMPVVTLNRAMIVAGVLLGLLLRQPLFTTALFVILASAVAFGLRGSLIFQVGSRLFAARNRAAPREDRRLMRFNNSIAVVVFGLAQIAFLARLPLLGWGMSLLVALAAAVALAGFCVGCFLYYQFKLQRYRLLGGRSHLP
jgi:hypothetical protein